MYLINIRKLTLEHFVGDYSIPPYFILSHTWSDDEVTYQDIRNLPPEALEFRKGWIKIKGLCDMLLGSKDWLASDVGFYRTINYVWVDTCCINKESSTELSEAINSMYRWYQQAAACIVYLEDVSDVSMESPELKSSRWFTRGWTLQELLAPHYVVFYSSFWKQLGSRVLNSQLISEITGIHSKFLDGSAEVADASTAEKMSWASQRETTRSEDIAYCLMGLFDINMPLLYGEGGEKAFIRLQEEILKDSTDESIFAWDASMDGEGGAGMLAVHPSRFHDGANIIPLGTRKNPQAVRNGGILMQATVVDPDGSTSGTSFVDLDCATEDDLNPKHRVIIEVFRRPECCRAPSPCFIGPKSDVADEALFFLKRSPRVAASAVLHRCEVFWEGATFTLLEAWPGSCWTISQAGDDEWGRGVLESRLSRRQFSLNLRRAMQLSQDAGLDGGSATTIAALALRPSDRPTEAFLLGISLESLNGKFTISMRNIRGQAFPTCPEDFQYSHHWSCISGLIDAWGCGKEVFGNMEAAGVETTSFTINAVGLPALIDRRKGVEVHVFAHAKEPSNAALLLPKRVVPSEPLLDVPPKEYWQPYYKEPESRPKRETREETQVARLIRMKKERDETIRKMTPSEGVLVKGVS